MALCTKCCLEVNEDNQCYRMDNMGFEIIALVEHELGHEVDANEILCARCFTNIIASLSSSVPHDGNMQDLNEDFELERRHDTNVCVWCRSTLFGRRSHYLPEGPARHLISERISPRQIPDGSLVCYGCWLIVRRILEQQGVDITFESDRNSNTCVWCVRSLNQRRSHLLTEGPERNEIMSKIHPRQIPLNGRVCYACWVSARRNIQRTEQRNTNGLCEICRMALFRRRIHTVATGPDREAVASIIYPREISEHPILCFPCWRKIEEYVQGVNEEMEQAIPQPIAVPVQLDNFAHTTSSSRQCFVPLCRNPERLCVPSYLRKRILNSQKIFVTDNARICNEHKSIYNWEFLEQYEFSKNFTKHELESMLSLSIQEINNNLDFENIQLIDDEVFVFWTGFTKEKYFTIFNTIHGTLKCKKPHTALGVYLIKARTGDSHDRISSLLGLNKTSVTRLLNIAREALIRSFVPQHLGINNIERQELINKNLIIPEGLFGNREERVPIIICDGTYVYLQKSSNYLFQKKTYSLHKYRNLVKPFLLVATDGHIIDVFGPYPATESDASIMKALFQNENSEVRQYFRPNDVFILDRGFRDAIPFMEDLGYKIHKPETLETGEIQLPAIKANKSRCVTLCRWVVEVVNGRFKRDFKLFRQEYFNLAATHLMEDFQICASFINVFHPKIENRPDAPVILNRALHRRNMPNILAEQIMSNRINRVRAPFTSISGQLPELAIFPEMTMSDLIIFALGVYQIKQAKAYYGEHVREHGSFRVEVSENLEVVSQATSSQEDPVLIRGRIKSRHHSGRTYYTYILIARQGISWDDRIIGYYCSCIAGQRTVGCCAHIMTIVWYLGWARYQVSIAAPATFLDGILIRDDLENE